MDVNWKWKEQKATFYLPARILLYSRCLNQFFLCACFYTARMEKAEVSEIENKFEELHSLWTLSYLDLIIYAFAT